MPDQYEISSDPQRLDIPTIHQFLRTSYWAADIPLEVVERAIRHSLCFGAFVGDSQQVGFARAVTDRATFAYVADVFVLPSHRGRGVAKLLLAAILAHPDLRGLRRFLLATKDAHALYEHVGFRTLPNPEQFMTIHHPDVYRSAG
jgi:GNAT superfamily N-acetyltransferase